MNDLATDITKKVAPPLLWMGLGALLFYIYTNQNNRGAK